jgi:hypothetical protein
MAGGHDVAGIDRYSCVLACLVYVAAEVVVCVVVVGGWDETEGCASSVRHQRNGTDLGIIGR